MAVSAIGFASSATSDSGLLGSLGVDVQLLVLQSVAFLLLLLALAKWVFPSINAMLDRRDKKIEESLKAASEAEKNAEKSQAEVEKLLKKARKEADEIILLAKTEASALVDTAEKKSRERAERIISDAEAEIQRDIEKARRVLKKDTIELVAIATEKILDKSVTPATDTRFIEQVVDEVDA